MEKSLFFGNGPQWSLKQFDDDDDTLNYIFF